MAENDLFIDSVDAENAFMLKYLVTDDVSCGSLDLHGSFMSHYVYCMLLFTRQFVFL